MKNMKSSNGSDEIKADTVVYYSTPFGEDKEGRKRPFILSGPEGTAYIPVFLTKEDAFEFYNSVGRVNFMIMEGDIRSVVRTTHEINTAGKAPILLGILYDPFKHRITIDADKLGEALEIFE